MTSVIMPTACLKTSRPSILRCPTVPVVDGPPSTKSLSLWVPSERRLAAMTPRSAGVPALSSASSTSAPAPSPNSTQVERSLQSRMREKVSEPITSTRLRQAALDVEIGGRERIDEAAAHRLHVEGEAVAHAEPLLDVDGGGGKSVVRRRGRQHDQVDVVGGQPGIGKRRARGSVRRARRSSRRRRRCGAAGCRCAARSTRPTSRPCLRNRYSS